MSANQPSPSVDLEAVRARAYQRALDQARAVPDGFLSAADAIRASGLGIPAFYAAVSAGRIRTTRFADGLRAYRRDDVEALVGDASDE
jgi:hypothetical protein